MTVKGGSFGASRAENSVGTGSASVMVYRAGFGVVTVNTMVRSVQTGCEGTQWESETSVRCKVTDGAGGPCRVVVTAGGLPSDDPLHLDNLEHQVRTTVVRLRRDDMVKKDVPNPFVEFFTTLISRSFIFAHIMLKRVVVAATGMRGLECVVSQVEFTPMCHRPPPD